MNQTSDVGYQDKLFKVSQAKNHSARVLLALGIMLFTITTLYEASQPLFSQDKEFSTYIYLRIILSLTTISIFIASFVSKKLASKIHDISFFFFLAFFYVLSFNNLVKDTVWGLNYSLLVLAMFIFASFISLRKIVAFFILSNAVVIYFSVQSYEAIEARQFLLVYLIVTASFTLIRLLRDRFDASANQLDQFFEEIFNAIRDSVLLIDPISNKVVFNNKTAVKVFGSVSDVEKRIAKEYINTYKTALKMIYDFKGNWEGEIEFQDKRGINFISLVSISYFRVKAQELIFVKIADISKLKYAEKQLKDVLLDVQEKNNQLQESKKAIMNILEDVVVEREEAKSQEQKLAAILQSITEGVIVLDINKRVFLFNDALLRMLKLNAEDISNKLFSEVLDFRNEKTDESIGDFVEKAYQGETVNSSANINSILRRRDGSDLPISESASPIYNDQKQVHRVVVVIRDATEQRRVDKMRTEFVSVVSHQLRTPLTSINWYVELLDDPETSSNLNEMQKESVARIGEGNKRMIALVNDLLNVSRIETGKNFTLEVAETEYVGLIKEVIDEQRIVAQKKGIDIEFNTIGIENLNLNIDKVKIRQVIMNLLSNAVKYSLPNSEVLLKFGKDEKNIYLDIIDHGIGIPEDQQDRVFEKFFRANNAVTQQTEGTGLGMYIGKSIAEAHGGEVTFYSKQNSGTTFTLKLPLEWSAPENKAALNAN